MQYITQLNEFHKFARKNKIKPAARNLYFTLLDISNSLLWVDSFTHSDRQVMAAAGISSSDTCRKARQELIDNGLIEYIPSRKRGRASEWHIKAL